MTEALPSPEPNVGLMKGNYILTAASTRFEAARHVDSLPDGHRSRSMHGHGFIATVYGELPQAWADFRGDEVGKLHSSLVSCIRPLDYALLNTTIERPTDENIARWIRSHIDSPAMSRIAIQSTPHHGVVLDNRDMAHVWRRYRFQAAHRLPHVPAGHKCGRMHGHGFEVIIHANQDLGTRDLSIDYDHLDEVWAPLQFELAFQCLNKIEGLSNPTSELISSWIWKRLKPVVPELSWITVFETASCGATFDGSQYRIWKDFTLDSAMRHEYAPQGDRRRNIHGHTYTLRLYLSAPLDQIMGWTVDFGDVKAIFDPIFKSLDHHPLYDISDIENGDTASIGAWIYRQAKDVLPQLMRIDLYETEGCGSIVTEIMEGPALPI